MAGATSTGMVSWEKSREESRNLLTLSKCIVSVLCTQEYSSAKYRGGGGSHYETMLPLLEVAGRHHYSVVQPCSRRKLSSWPRAQGVASLL